MVLEAPVSSVAVGKVSDLEVIRRWSMVGPTRMASSAAGLEPGHSWVSRRPGLPEHQGTGHDNAEYLDVSNTKLFPSGIDSAEHLRSVCARSLSVCVSCGGSSTSLERGDQHCEQSQKLCACEGCKDAGTW